MKRLITAALLIVLGAAQAMPVARPSLTGASTATAAQPGKATERSLSDLDLDDDEAAPPVHIHRADSSNKKANKKPSAKPSIKKLDASGKKSAPAPKHIKRFPLPASQ